MIVIVISGIVWVAASSVYQMLQHSSTAQENSVRMQQDERVAMDIFKSELRMAGYDPTSSKIFGITDISFRDLNNNLDSTNNGNSSITFTTDTNGNGAIDTNETYSYALYDFSEGTYDVASRDLSRNTGGGRQLLAENIQYFELAYAYDANGDGNLDTDGAGNIIWAIAQGNGSIWYNLDTNGDGQITAADAPAAVNGISTITGVSTGTPINRDANNRITDIRAIRIWMLIQSKASEKGYLDHNTYVVGRKIVIPSQMPSEQTSGHRYRLMEAIINCRNLGL